MRTATATPTSGGCDGDTTPPTTLQKNTNTSGNTD